jgi:methionine biosynthesis protein MetW
VSEASHNAGSGRGETSRRDRALDDLIVGLASPGERVLDLGCGSGDLLQRLRDEKSVRERGIEIDGRAVADAIAHGLSVAEGDLEEGLSFLSDSSFDLVVINQVLPLVRDPAGLIDAALRVGRRVAVTFPNFAFWKVRAQLFFSGRMPVTPALPFPWHDTPHIRYFTVADFQSLCETEGWRVRAEIFASQNGAAGARRVRTAPNLRASLALFLLSRS